MSTIDFSTRQQMSFERGDQADLAYRAVEWPDSFTAEKLSIVHLQRGYDYPMSADDIRREEENRRIEDRANLLFQINERETLAECRALARQV